jgi:hypothetical protein
MGCHRSSRCCRKRPAAYPLLGTNRTDSFPTYPPILAIVLAVNTGLRDSNVCGWNGFEVPTRGRAKRLRHPPEAFKVKRPCGRPNDAAWSIVQGQRGKDPEVFPYRGQRIDTMNNSAWQRARRNAGLCSVRIHDLRHTYATRLRAAGVPGRRPRSLARSCEPSMAGHYASTDIGPAYQTGGSALNRGGTCTACGSRTVGDRLWIKGPARVPQR